MESDKLGFYIDFVKGYAFKSKDYQLLGKKIIRVSDFTADSIDITSCKCISFEGEEEYEKYLLKTNDVVISTVGSWPGSPSVVGKVVRIPLSANDSLLNQNAVILKPKKGLQKNYLYYLLKNHDFKNYIEGSARGSANQASITLESIRTFFFDLPKRDKQQKIASILSSLDDKIECNNKMNQTLEKMAQSIFKEWFEEFNFPNAEGKPYKTDKGAMQTSELGEIPEGWEVKSLKDLARNKAKTQKFAKTDYAVFVNTGDISKGQFLHTNRSLVGTLPGQAKKLIEKNDILFSEIRPKNKRFLYVHEDMPKHIVSTKFMVLKANDNIVPRYLYMLITDENIIREINTIAESRSGTFPQITFDSIGLMAFVIPPIKYQEKFCKILNNFDKIIIKNNEQTQTLTKLRDTLLPKLMSGEIKV